MIPQVQRPAPGQARAKGVLLLIVGVGLAGAMAYLAWYLNDLIAAPPDPHGTGWTGSPAMTRDTFWIFGTVGLIGVGAVLNGVWVMRHGAFNRALRIAFLLVAAALVIQVALFLQVYQSV